MLRSFLYNTKRIGLSSLDTSEERIVKRSLNIVVLALMLLSLIWSLMYFLLGLYMSALISGAFSVFSIAAFTIYNKTKSKDHLLAIVLPVLFVLPFGVQFDQGGLAKSGFIMLWSILVPMGSLLFKNERHAISWFLVFVVWVIAFVYFDDKIAAYSVREVPLTASKIFMALNIVFVISVSFFSMQHYMKEADVERKKNLRLLELAHRHKSEIEIKNKELERTLLEREILLKEIHHRVKNNMQVVTSLLSLQSSYISDEPTKALFRYSQYRITSMAIVHEMLYKSKDLGQIKYSDYIERLVTQLISSMKGVHNNVDFRMGIPEIFLNIDTAIPLGLLINEVVTNALKYGIKGSDPGILYVKIEKTDKNSYLLHIGDNGPGFPEDKNFRGTNSLGILLMHNLALQLEGNIEKINQPGTNYLISFNQISQTS